MPLIRKIWCILFHRRHHYEAGSYLDFKRYRCSKCRRVWP